jgi:hypothetical protein
MFDNGAMKHVGRIGAICAFFLCLAGGVWILTSVGFEHGDDDGVWTGLGLYFVGKAFFVGPMLLLMTEQLRPAEKAAS